ncbi:hypothetical protein [Faecalibaculum rodentium]|uniref:hypothetical protein n=1 Tax=Faecalibaculum rodentium TaxID=1702221 RepID=UPI0023F51366|nr:hypothetical protein [Faecalibaculum rodentium]
MIVLQILWEIVKRLICFVLWVLLTAVILPLYAITLIWGAINIFLMGVLILSVLMFVFSEEFRMTTLFGGGWIPIVAGLLLWAAVSCGGILVFGLLSGLWGWLFETTFS